ncbi:MAG: RagB/SusD family nutrient uptake outer membrane protein [Bacteroides sp.]|uniref:RagB/SusD family nutrient uptake outer membrane protein n=1 Tax=Bacteroides sp. TaxID=29523 RepID=UPI001B4450AC|nr:RagB/SusD family nutrient uptake outer membrane protein [Bacteroides sp.]MBP6065697.1 RagB/SusD family nutrient uptake outer membrane protein [Bacteroides sp.]MBP6067986.1 RagB/SusD family nutrient uptake outer membrane protein [Bacteroides sp.]
MKKINNIGIIVAIAAALTVFSGCSDQFLQDKRNYGNFGEEIYDTYIGAQTRVNTLYNYLLPSSTGSIAWNTVSAGTGDINAKSTEEYGGFSDYVNPNVILDNKNVPDYIFQEFGSTNNKSPYGHIRECNMVIEGLRNSSLEEAEKKELLGQALFFRAWAYFRLVRTYGGVPLIKFPQNPIIGDGAGPGLVEPRSTTKEAIDFICGDLQMAADYLPARWTKSAQDFGRITSGAALALQGRARLLYASPLFNRADNKDSWKLAYESNKASIAKLQEGGFGLDNLESPGVNGAGWAKMFSAYASKEAVFVTLYNNVKTGTGTNYNKNNGWENSIRPINTGGSGGKGTTAQMVDMFPMADGKKPYDANSKYLYDPQRFFLNRDPRFYRTFAFPGVEWKFSGTPANQAEHPEQFPYVGANYVLWSYAWYEKLENQTKDNQAGYGADGLGANNKSVYIRKRTDDMAVSESPLYLYDNGESNRAFQYSGAPYMEIRYAEVLLNFAEAACGVEKYQEAVDALKLIRQRVGYTGDCGLDEDLITNRAKLFSAILYERQIELAYEGKRFDDMRRWLLWDGGEGQENLKSTWKVTGFNGNTCNYLGVQPLNNQRRTGIEIQVADKVGQAEEKDGKDPIISKGIMRPAAINLMKDIMIAKKEEETPKPNTAVDNLADFYREYLYRKDIRVDGSLEYTISFKPQYYFIGFKTNMQANNITLNQTIGWPDAQNGNADGTYDPLAE